MSIKPIETVYNGYRFRSRIEARWAVFFDEAKIAYEYEQQGFELEDGTWYLPDFYLPKYDAYVEIKHGNLNNDEVNEIEAKCENLQADKPESCVLLCKGDPVDMNITIFCSRWNGTLGIYEPWSDNAAFLDSVDWWVACIDKSGRASIIQRSNYEFPMIAVGKQSDFIAEEFAQKYIVPRCLITDWRELNHERTTARRARFEFGETPKVSR